MPWRLIGWILILGIFLVFIALNLGNSCSISFGFRVFSNVPVYLTAFVSFALGLLCAIPVAVFSRLGKKKGGGASPVKEKKGKGRKKGEETIPAEDVPGANGPYGID
ncbi:MAG: hypothetical protein LBP23_00270 [Treponema sp.]|jgi:uncharacterized integral membrane protein|nr:hypothetical protein [Treponema sp.]